MSDVVAGVAWASDSASSALSAKRAGKNPKHKGSVANMSLGGGKSVALDSAVDAAVDAGLHFAVAAGSFRFFFLFPQSLACADSSYAVQATTIRMPAVTVLLRVRTPSPFVRQRSRTNEPTSRTTVNVLIFARLD